MSAVIDDYEPLEVIGNGSFGVIRKVKRRSDGQLFARKELNFERMTDRDRKQIVAEVYVATSCCSFFQCCDQKTYLVVAQ